MYQSLRTMMALLGFVVLTSATKADLFGPSENTTILTGHGYNPQNPENSLQTPFRDLTVRREINGTGRSEFKMELTQDFSSSTRDFYLGAELKAKIGFFGAQSSVDVSSQTSSFRKGYSLFLYASTDYGSEFLADQTTANLNDDARALLNNPAGWVAKYGTQIVTRRRRGASVLARIVFNTLDTRRVNSFNAAFKANYSGISWSGEASAQLKTAMTEAMSSLNASISVVAYGGNGISELNLTSEDGPSTEFGSWLNMINRYLRSLSFENSAITGYQTSSYTTFLQQAQDPFSASLADAYLRYISLKAKADALDGALANPEIEVPWLNPDQILNLVATRDLCRTRANEAWTYGVNLAKNPKLVQGQTLPEDVGATFPVIPEPTIQTFLLDPQNRAVRIRFKGAWRLKAQYVDNEGRLQQAGFEPYSEGTLVYMNLPFNLYSEGQDVQFRIFDQNNVQRQTVWVKLVGTNGF